MCKQLVKIVIDSVLIGVCFCLGMNFCLAEEDCEQAARLVKKGVRLSDGSAQEREVYQEAIKLCERMPEPYFNLGVIYSKTGKKREALSEFKKALELRNSPRILIAVANLELENGNLQEARRRYEEVLESDDRSVDAYQGLSVVYEKLGQKQKATDVLTKSLAIKEDVITYYNLAVLHYNSGQIEKAVTEFERAVELDSHHFDALFYLGLAYKESNSLEKGIRVLKQAAQIKPDDVEVYRALGVMYEILDEHEKAEQAFRRSISLDDSDVSTFVNLAVVLINKQQESQAEEYLKRAGKIDPDNSRVYSVLGWAQLKLGRYEEAEKSLQKAIDLDPLNALVLNNLGVLYQQTGRQEEAAEIFRKVQKLGGGKSAVQENAKQFLE
jgi:tetratricopeptide (TPR) repeat protein